MRTIPELQQEINDLQKRHESLGFTGQTKQTKIDGKRVAFLNKAILCLEKRPTEDFLNKQLELCQKHINIINRDYPAFLKDDPIAKEEISAGRNPRTKWNSMNDLKKWNEEMYFIRFILD